MNKKITSKDILKANIEYHTKLSNLYNKDQGHFKAENIKRVENILKDLSKKTNGGSLLDIGCGTGFIIDIAQKYFDKVVGIDITPAMLKKVKKFKNVETHLVDLSEFNTKEKFDVCTAYSVLHHLPRTFMSFKKINQFLKIGGYFYADQDPNFYYLQNINDNQVKFSPLKDLIFKEKDSINKVEVELEKKFNIDKKITKLAEYHKLTKIGAFKEENIINLLKKTRFSEIKFMYQWFLGQSYLKNKFSAKELSNIEKYLKNTLPISRPFFKYISFIAQK